ncbi:sucrose transport protein SUT1-like isoform X1 [Iris pallida]|uniref:Sucrose transport protein SUT1-like isoform X1 n=1 Tax=Iris pallida TaxID=29817 RepID=A0AAX6H360_IRIPA|nr:sucrose transport protein SUT1-like isoform X1 [Iris pallida]
MENESGNRKGGEVEMVGASVSDKDTAAAAAGEKPISLTRLIFACTVAGGVQYGWALQLSLLTPYVQTLGLSHSLSSLMWLCGPVAGFLVQPLVGLWSDRSHSRFGRRRPFILVGCILICCSVIVIGYSSDIGYALGDTTEDCSVYHGSRWKAAIVYVVGFWILDFSNNAVQGPTRALMADLSGHHGCNTANAIFASWMALGNILGYSSGASGGWHKWFPFLVSRACCEACGNLKGAFFAAVVFLLLSLGVTLVVAKEVPLSKSYGKGEEEKKLGFLDIFRSMRNLPSGMPSVLLVTSLTWVSWFPFILYNTDWMGREVYHGDPKGTPAQISAYDRGVREGAFGLLLNSIFLGIGAFMIEPMCRKLTARIVWVSSNFMVFLSLAGMVIVSFWSGHNNNGRIGADGSVRAVALVLFTVLGFPLAILFSVPFAYAAQLAVNQGEGGQGLCVGVLNISIVLPQVIVALGAGPWDALFGKGNVPAFALASVVAFVCCFVAMFMLPKLSARDFKTSGIGGGH